MVAYSAVPNLNGSGYHVPATRLKVLTRIGAAADPLSHNFKVPLVLDAQNTPRRLPGVPETSAEAERFE